MKLEGDLLGANLAVEPLYPTPLESGHISHDVLYRIWKVGKDVKNKKALKDGVIFQKRADVVQGRIEREVIRFPLEARKKPVFIIPESQVLYVLTEKEAELAHKGLAEEREEFMKTLNSKKNDEALEERKKPANAPFKTIGEIGKA